MCKSVWVLICAGEKKRCAGAKEICVRVKKRCAGAKEICVRVKKKVCGRLSVRARNKFSSVRAFETELCAGVRD